jgi:uncharacterized protein
MVRLKVLMVAMGMGFAMASTPINAQSGGSYEIRAIAELEQACLGGDAVDCDELGMRHLRGEGVAKDPKKATTYFQRACDRGDARGCFNLGDSYQFGEGVPKDAAKAAALYLRACDGRDPEGCTELAMSHIAGDGVKQSEAQAALYADRACTLKNQLGCAILGAAYADGVEGYPQDVAKAKDLLFDACHKGTRYSQEPDRAARLACPAYTKITGEAACKTVGSASTGEVQKHCFDAGAGWVTTVAQGAASPVAKAAVPAPTAPSPANVALSAGNAAYARKDYTAASGQFAKACDAGLVEACGALGEMYATGQGVAANGKVAAPMLAKACDAGIAKACGTLGGLYDRGIGVTGNKALAFRLFSGACAKADMAACYRQGALYFTGEGSDSGADYSKAASLFERACTAGVGDSCNALGYMYDIGRHFPENESKAVSFYSLSCSKGSKQGCESLADKEREREQERKAAAIAALPRTNADSPSYGRLPCLKISSQTSGGREVWRETNVIDGIPAHYEYVPGITTFTANNNCNENIVKVDMSTFQNYKRGFKTYYSDYARVFAPGSSFSYYEDDLYFTESDWRIVSNQFK